ncbi:hypothetical protein DFH28DRAFT_1150949 [Melampsora americana]|nr:hypothetical protein DFH28DRAFT_1150949 [Melampsora americana]
MDASYPALELAFASEPARETKQETKLPPLKKLRSTWLNGEDQDDANNSDYCLQSKDHISPEEIGLPSPIYTSPVSRRLGSSPLASALVVSNPPTSRPLSRRTSSNRADRYDPRMSDTMYLGNFRLVFVKAGNTTGKPLATVKSISNYQSNDHQSGGKTRLPSN